MSNADRQISLAGSGTFVYEDGSRADGHSHRLPCTGYHGLFTKWKLLAVATITEKGGTCNSRNTASRDVADGARCRCHVSGSRACPWVPSGHTWAAMEGCTARLSGLRRRASRSGGWAPCCGGSACRVRASAHPHGALSPLHDRLGGQRQWDLTTRAFTTTCHPEFLCQCTLITSTLVRASTISPSQLAIRSKIIYSCLVGGERREERRRVGSHARASSSTYS
jgi:hypothetical protein